jgi:hypothetical protein
MKKTAAKTLLISVLVLLPLFRWQTYPVMANGNDRLGASVHYEIRGEVTASGVGLRGIGAGNIVLNTVPPGASVYRAFLYWATLGSVNTYTSPTLNGALVQGQLIGTSGDTCWGIQHNFVYRADVTSLVQGNGTYSIAGLPSNLLQGNDSQGASLVVVYSDSALPYRTIIIHDGAVSLNFARNSYTNILGGFRVDPANNDAHISYLVGDGQVDWDAGNVSFNTTPIAAGIFTGIDGPFWGTHRFDVSSLVTGSPVTTTINNLDPDNPNSPDCLLWAATVFSVASPEPETTNRLAAFYNQSLYGDATVTGVGLRGRGQGNLVVSGVPNGANVYQSFLYWATIGSSSQYVSPQLNGSVVTGEVIGASADTCWGAERNVVYRAEVSHLVQGNGTYTITGLPNDLAAGNDSQGAALVVIYSDPRFRTILINDGAVTLDLSVHSYTDRLGPFTADQPNAQTRVTYMIGDGQSNWNSGSVNFEGQNIANNVFTGVDGEHWGTLSFDVTGLITEPEATTTINNNNPGGPYSPDCLLWAGTVLSVATELPDYSYKLYFPIIAR